MSLLCLTLLPTSERNLSEVVMVQAINQSQGKHLKYPVRFGAGHLGRHRTSHRRCSGRDKTD